VGLLQDILNKAKGKSTDPNNPDNLPAEQQIGGVPYNGYIDDPYAYDSMLNMGMRSGDQYGMVRPHISEEVQRILITPDIPDDQKATELWVLWSTHLGLGNINAREHTRIKRRFKYLIMISHFGSPKLLMEKALEIFGGDIMLSKARGDKEGMREREAQVASISVSTSKFGKIERPKDSGNTSWINTLRGQR
jgi:hypothetical protein